MAVDFKQIEDELPKVFASLLTDTEVSWWEKPKRHQIGRNANGQQIDLRIGTMIPDGLADEFTTFNVGACAGEEIERCVAGTQQFTIQAEAWTEAQGFGSNALRLVKELEAKLRCETATDALSALGLAFIDSENPAPVPDNAGGHRRIRWSLPLIFGGVVAFSTSPTTFIESATVSGTLDADGDLGIAVPCTAP